MYTIYVMNLSLADGIMGVYLLFIAASDIYYRGEYGIYQRAWKTSYACRMCGFISLLSIGASNTTVAMITYERYSSIKNPFKNLQSNKLGVQASLILCWIFSAMLSAFSLSMTDPQVSVCLLITLVRHKSQTNGVVYTLLGLNSILCFSVIIFSVLLYQEISKADERRAGYLGGKATRNKSRIFMQVALVSASSILSWSTVGIVGLLQFIKPNIPRIFEAWSALLLLPLN